MTPKEKADSIFWNLHDKIYNGIHAGEPNVSDLEFQNVTKKCAIITVDAILSEIGLLHKPEYVVFQEKDADDEWYNGYSRDDYWEEVKKEIEKL